MSALRVTVLSGGLTFERDVSLRSGRRVVDALRTAGVEAECRDADAGLLAHLEDHPPDAVVVALHGGPGEDGAIRAVLDMAGVPYVGATPEACRISWDKPLAKQVVRAAGVAAPDGVVLPHTTFRELGAAAVLDRIVGHLDLPLMVKPAQGGSALGATAVHRADELSAAMVHCFSYGDTALVESFVAGVELAVSVVDVDGTPRALPAVEIAPKEGVFDYAARYTAGATEYYTPARLDPDVLARVGETALTVHRALGLRDLSRTDLIVDAAGLPWFLEVNSSPGLTETSLLPMSVAAEGLDLGRLWLDLVERAIARA
jgi:D-alanine-D-alanine ligase